MKTSSDEALVEHERGIQKDESAERIGLHPGDAAVAQECAGKVDGLGSGVRQKRPQGPGVVRRVVGLSVFEVPGNCRAQTSGRLGARPARDAPQRVKRGELGLGPYFDCQEVVARQQRTVRLRENARPHVGIVVRSCTQ